MIGVERKTEGDTKKIKEKRREGNRSVDEKGMEKRRNKVQKEAPLRSVSLK